MRKKLLVEKHVVMTRIALLQEEEWTEFYTDFHIEEDLQDQVVIGQIEEVVKNLKAVFVNYGSDKNGMLHIKHIPEYYQARIHQGARLPIQVVKQNTGEKGHRLTGKINLKGRYLVCLPFEEGINISKKIKDETLRVKIKEKLEAVSHYGFIVRTHARDANLEALVLDAKRLCEEADRLMQVKDHLEKGTVLYKAPPLALSVLLEELVHCEELELVSNDDSFLAEARVLVSEFGLEEKVAMTTFDKDEDMFSIYSLNKQMDSLLNRKIWLKNGGNLVIDYTEAMTIIDVNSAKAILTKNQRCAVVSLNELAVKEAFLQIQRRNLSGIILIDLVEMPHKEDREALYMYAKRLISHYGDSRSKVYPLTELGLLQVVRTAKYIPLHHKMLMSCGNCHIPYGQISLVYQMFLLEKKLKDISVHTVQKEVFISCEENLLQKIQEVGLKSKLEETYQLLLHIDKMEKTSKNMFLCQFYQK